MRSHNVKVFDQYMREIAILDKAFDVGYSCLTNKVNTATFSLLISDPKNEYCQPFNYIKLYEDGRFLDTYRIMNNVLEQNQSTYQITYTCEHVLATLIDTLLFQYHEIGGLGTYTADIIRYLLSKQSRWILGNCEFSRQFQYEWQNENLLSALLAIIQEFDESALYTWDTSVYPWKLNLIAPSNEIKAYLRYGRNIKGIKRTVETKGVCTRMYALGYGEGVNQLDISKVNPTGKPYIDADTQNKYGIIENTLLDRRYQIEASLYEATRAKLEAVKNPIVTYEIDAVELYRKTKIPIDKFDVGDVVMIEHDKLGIKDPVRIISKAKSRIEIDDMSVTVRLSNEKIPKDWASSISDRTRINEAYAQGATIVNFFGYPDNCDPDHPAKIRIDIPAEAVQINKVELSFQVDRFRSFSKGSAAVPSTTSGPSSTLTSGPSSLTTTGQSSTTTTGQSSTTTTGQSSTNTTGQSNVNSSGASSVNTTVSATENVTLGILGTTPPPFLYVIGTDTQLTGPNQHSHGVNDHVHQLIKNGHSHGIEHNHSILHDHNIMHTHNIEHTHNISHTHNITHTHTIDHTHTIPSHTHDPIYGIYEGPIGSNYRVVIDGTEIPINKPQDNINIVPYLSKDGGGMIQRSWHEILIYPDDLSRIYPIIKLQYFVNSRGGGRY